MSAVTAFIIGISRSLNSLSFLFVYIFSAIILFAIYWIITKLYPKSQNWGAILWIVALVSIPIIIIFVLAIVEAFIAGMTGSSSNINLQNNSPLPLTSQPTPTGVTPYVQPLITLQSTPTASEEATEAQKIAQAIDYLNNPTVHNFALQQVQHSSSGYYNIAQICDVWQSIYNQWTYVSDPPNFDYWTLASDSINNGLKGNCADYAVLNAAVIESIGGSSRVVTACAPGGSPCHASAEVYLGNSQSELQAASNYICSRYNCGSIHSHTVTDAQGNIEYWLNLDWQAQFPGGPFFQDDGTYHVFYPDGGYSDAICSNENTCTITKETNENVLLQQPLVAPTMVTPTPAAPITIINNVVNIPYDTNEGYYFNGNTGNIYQISVNADLTPVNILVLDQTNYNLYQNAFKTGSAVSFNAVTYKSVGSEDFDYTLPSSGTYYVVIDNSNFLTGSANSKISAHVTTKILLIGNS